MATFIVTGHGRSGTRWLARELNRSREWDVFHEHAPPLFDHQGTVNGYLRFNPELIESVDRFAVILRHPVSIAQSVKGRSPGRWGYFLANLKRDLDAVAFLARNERVQIIRFDEVTNSPLYLLHAAVGLGLRDVNSDRFDMNTTGSTSKPLTAGEQGDVIERAEWFIEEFDL